MTGDPMPPEGLAAYLDGSATAEERETVLRLLASDRVQYAQFVEAVQIRAGLDADAAVAALSAVAVPSPADSRRVATPSTSAATVVVTEHTTTRSARALRVVAPLLLAAALIAVVVITRNARVNAAGTADDVLAVAELVEVPTRGNGAVARALGAGTADPAWTVTRGSDEARQVSARAFRVGVRVAQMELAAAANDSAAMLVATDALQQLMSSVDGAAPLSASLGAVIAGGALPATAERRALAQQVRTLTGAAPWFDLGVWTESARHAAYRPRTAFFAENSAAVAHLQRLLAAPRDGAEWRDATQPLRELMQQPRGAWPLGAIRQALDTVALTAGG